MSIIDALIGAEQPKGTNGNGKGHETAVPAVGPVMHRPKEPCAFVIFGASGDLTHRKLIPALYNLACANLLPDGFSVVGFAMTPMDSEGFRADMREWVMNSPEATAFRNDVWDRFAPNMHYVTADFEQPEGYKKLKTLLEKIDGGSDLPDNRLFYCATPPSFYATIVERLGKHGLVFDNRAGGPWSRIIIEKPFGTNLQSARQLNDDVHKVFHEEDIYRIDHYLGKETVQNIFAFRFANSIIEPIWNRMYVDHVQITAAETLGVEHRARYYEEAGCLRDMFQNHLLQLMALVAMDPPVRYDGRSVRDRKADVLRAIVPINPENLSASAVRGQYGPGEANGMEMPGYRQEPGIDPQSNTETFAAMRLMIENWRWADVPFYIRSGKRMPKKLTEISIQFRRVPHQFFHEGPGHELMPNRLTIQVQPDEGIALRLGAKLPGPEMIIKQVQMEFDYAECFGVNPATAYETLLLDAMMGDPTLFNRGDAVELAWEVLAPVLETWSATKPFHPFPNYAGGTWGPKAADDLLAQDGRAWKNG
jgi:glucose-6-phosphate 1-dehydrogenase